MITIYGTSNCMWCKEAVKLAESRKLPYVYKGIDDNLELYEELKAKAPDVKKVPQIWWDDRHVGGFTALAAEIENTIGGYGDGTV